MDSLAQLDHVDVVALTRALVDIDSTTGREGECGRFLADYLRRRDWVVSEQRVDTSRFNVIAVTREPEIAFSTHFDCVPPFFPSRVSGDRLHGRGSCDARVPCVRGLLRHARTSLSRCVATRALPATSELLSGEGPEGDPAAARRTRSATQHRPRLPMDGARPGRPFPF